MEGTLRLGRQHPVAMACGAAILAVVVAALVFLVLPPSQGPFAEHHSADEGYNTTGGPALTNQFFDGSLETVALEGSQPAVLDYVEPLHPEQARGLTLRYASLLHGAGGADRGWPPRGVVRPVAGTVIQPGQNAIIWVGVASPTVRRWRLQDFVLRYHIGRGHYSATIHQALKGRVVSHCSFCAD